MSLLALFRAGMTANRLKAAGSAVFTFAEVAGLGLSAAHLADEVAREIMGDDYDPAMRDLAEQVIEAGQAYDEKLHQIVQVNGDINNVVGGINSLTSIVLDFGERQELVRDRLEQLVALRETLSTTTPITYSWFETIRLRALQGLTFEEIEDQVEQLKAVNGPNYLHMGYFAAELAGALGMRAWAHWKGSGSRPPAGGLGQTPAGQAPNPQRMTPGAQQQTRVRFTRLQGGLASVRSTVAHGYRIATSNPKINASVRAVFSSASFAMGLYFLVEKVRARNEAMEVLSDMLELYEHATPVYGYVLDGAPDSDALEAIGELFEIDLDTLSDDARASMEAGYHSAQAEYDDMLENILDGMGVAYDDIIGEFEAVALETDAERISDLKAGRDTHEEARVIALDTDLAGEDRAGGIVMVRDNFVETVSGELNETLAALSEAITNHGVLHMLNTAAANLADKRHQIDDEMEALREEHPEWSEDIFAVFLEQKLATFESDIVSEAARLTSDFDQIYADRSLLQTVAEVEEALRLAIAELVDAVDEGDEVADADGAANADDAADAVDAEGADEAALADPEVEAALVA